MFRPTRLVTVLNSVRSLVDTQIRTTNQNFAFHFLCLISGFFLGNVFGTFLVVLREWLKSDLFIVGFLLLLSEFISFQSYKRVSREQIVSPYWFSWRPLNLIKLGLLFGFFVDAFKVGS